MCVVVVVISDSAPIIKNFNAKEVEEGAPKAVLRCNTDRQIPAESVTFYVNGIPVSKSHFSYRYRVVCQRLKVDSPVFPDDNVTVGCKVQNKYGFDFKNTTLSVFGELFRFD